jgi:hypothetical protein
MPWQVVGVRLPGAQKVKGSIGRRLAGSLARAEVSSAGQRREPPAVALGAFPSRNSLLPRSCIPFLSLRTARHRL